VPIDEAFHLIQPAGSSRHPDAPLFVEWLLSAVQKSENANNHAS
jgi:LysR family glycine cleavage system transcriptional activator